MAKLGNMKPMGRNSNGRETLKPARGVSRKGTTPAAKPNKVEKLIQDVTNRYRVTAREARDIITAAGTVIKTPNANRGGGWGFEETKKSTAVRNLKKQVVETAKAAATGKKGTSSDTMGYPKNYVGPTDKRKSSGGTLDYPYVKGAKRK
jgi:hypothetical protein